ncbi:MAG: L,D-transpeptidase family protein [Syntrophaceae bacterium]
MGKGKSRIGQHFCFFFACIIMTSILISGCGYVYEGSQVRSTFKEATIFFNQGNYRSSLRTYAQVIEKYPAAGDRALFEMGMIYAYPMNKQKDYRKALECFQKLTKDYPASGYWQDSMMMISHITTIITNDLQITTQQTQIDTLQQEIKSQGDEIVTLRKMIEALEQRVLAIQKVPADKILIEKKERRMTLISKGKVLKTYKIALGGNPNGPKERQGDNKTPEGVYIIDSKNVGSRYHLSLHISYPNETDKKRAKELGVSPGGNIMIHGIKNGYSWVGDLHTGFDWTNGCIAVTDQEIEEIDRLVPNGTIVEIRP